MKSKFLYLELGILRLTEWFEAGWPIAAPNEALCLGDKSIGDAVLEVLGRIPPPVVFHTVSQVLCVGVGRDSGGWAEVCRLDLEEPRILVAIASRPDEEEGDLLATIAHELSHTWLHTSIEVLPVAQATRSARRDRTQRLERVADEIGAREKYNLKRRKIKERKEREACRLAYAWGFTGRAAYFKRRGLHLQLSRS